MPGIRPDSGAASQRRAVYSAKRSTRVMYHDAAAVCCAPGPRPPSRGPPGPPGLRPDPSCSARWAPLGALFAQPPCRTRPAALRLRGWARWRALAPPPLRGAAPSPCSRWRPRAALALPPLPRSALFAGAPSPAPCGARWPRLPAAPPSRRCGLPVRSPLLCSCLGLVQRVAPWGARCGPPALAFVPRPARIAGAAGASGPAAPAPAPRRLRRRSSPPGAGAVLRARPAALAVRFSVRAAWVRLRRSQARYTFRVGGFLPCAPRPPPPLGAPGARGPKGASPPLWVALLAPLSRAPRRAARAPVPPFPAWLTVLIL